MGVLVVYRKQAEYAERVEEFLHDFKRRTGKEIEVISPDSPRGVDICRIYDVVEYPTILAVMSDGQLRNAWRGMSLPTIDEVGYYA